MIPGVSDRKQPTAMERAQSLLAQARAAALEQVRATEAAMEAVALLSREIGAGGDIYPPGVRDLCRRMADETDGQSRSLHALSSRLMDENARP